MSARLDAIAACMDNLELFRGWERRDRTMICMVGQLDQLEELHFLLYGTEGKMRFSDLETANRQRLPEFKNRKGEPAHSDPRGHDWSVAEWTNAMAGEAGEACNVAKKIIRGDYDSAEIGVRALMKEIADVVIYADLVCQRVGCRLESEVVAKFNEVSERVGSSVRL